MIEIDSSLLNDFATEAGEHLEEMESLLLKLAQDPSRRELLHDVFRPIHTIKGASQFMGLDRISSLSHKCEDLLDLLRRGEKTLDQSMIDTLMETKDRINLLIAELMGSQTEHTEVGDLILRIEHLIAGTEPEPEQAGTTDSTPTLAESETEDEIARLIADSLSVDAETETPPTSEPTSTESESESETASEIERLIADSLSVSAADAESTQEPLDDTSALETEEYIDQLIADSLKEESASGAESIQELLNEAPEQDTDEYINQLVADSLSAAPTSAAQSTITAQSTPPPTPAPEIASTAPQSVYEEEYDQELFQIFLKLLQEKTVLLRNQAQDWNSTTNKAETVEQYLVSLKRLESAANYMGYADLIVLYEQWIDEVQQIQRAIAQGQTVSLAGMESYITHLVSLFPQLEELLAEAALAPQAPPASLTLPTASTLPTPATPATPAAPLAPATPLTEAVTAAVPKPTVAVATQPQPVLPTALPPAARPAAKATTDQALLQEQLSHALEASLEAAGDESEERLLDVFEQMLAGAQREPLQEAPETTAARTEAEPVATAPQQPSKPPVASEQPTQQKPTQSALSQEPKSPEQKPPQAKTPDQKSPEEQRFNQKTGDRVFKKSVRVDPDKIDALMNQVGELIVDRSYFFQLFNDMRLLQQQLKDSGSLDQKEMKMIRTFTYRLGEAIVSLGRTSNELQEGVMKVRMLPIAQLFNRYPRLIHDLTHPSTNKQVQLEIRGEDTELDRMIIEEISDPLIHIIRNAVDHGFETTTDRKRAGKPEMGTLILEAYHESNHIVIEIVDDGRGINPERIKAKALEKGFYSKEELERMGSNELTRLVMTPGFSTADQVTNTSGRGVGMDVVKKNIERLNGTLEIESKVGLQTKIRLKIPLTLAIIQALMVQVGGNHFTIPLVNVEETLRIFEYETSTIEGTEVIYLRGKTMPIFRLSTLFSIPVNRTSDSKVFVVVVNSGFQKIGLVVDELMGQEEVVIKPLADYLQEKSGFSGATIIGDGRISLILDIYELINIAMNQQVSKHQDQSLMRKKAASDHHAYPVSMQ